MAHRVATEYVHANLTIPAADMPRLASLIEAQQLKLQVFVLENGNQEFALEDRVSGESVRLTFERCEENYRCRLTCRVVQPGLTNMLRRMVQIYRGDAVVHRIYVGFTMVYHYRNGSVVHIAECKDGAARTVFELHDPIGRLEAQFSLRSVEEEIDQLRLAVNQLLDQRNMMRDEERMAGIDRQLRQHSKLLFMLEA